MNIKLCTSNQEFIDLFHDYLVEYEVEMQLFYRNLLNPTEDVNSNNLRGGIYEDDKLLIIFLNAYPFNLQIFSMGDDNYTAFDYLCQYFVENKITIRGCQGNLNDCQQFISTYNDWTGKLITYTLSMDILKLTTLNKEHVDLKGYICNPTEKHFNIVYTGLSNFQFEALGEEADEEALKLKTSVYLKNKNFYLYYNEDNKITSFAYINKCLPHGGCIGAVYTFPIFRGKGYAKNMMYMICEKALATDKFVSLFVDKKNPISNKVYKDIGFEILTDNYDCRILH